MIDMVDDWGSMEEEVRVEVAWEVVPVQGHPCKQVAQPQYH